MNPILGITLLVVAILGGGFFLFQNPSLAPNVEQVQSVTEIQSESSDVSAIGTKPETVASVPVEEKKENPVAAFLSQVLPKATTTSALPPKVSAPVETVAANTHTPTSAQVNEVPFYMLKNIWDSVKNEDVQVPVVKRPPLSNFVLSSAVPERAVDPMTVVLVRCKYTHTYTGNTTGQAPPSYVTGSGVVVSPDGYILTAAHLIRDQEVNRINEIFHETNTILKFDSCDVAFTDDKLTPIDANPLSDQKTAGFIPAGVAFAPTDEQYHPYQFFDPDQPGRVIYFDGGTDLDFALLKVDRHDLPYAPLVEKLEYIKTGEPVIGLGYPGLVIQSAQSLERIDGTFTGFSFMQSSSCIEKPVMEECGLGYQAKRFKEDYKTLYGKQTSLGKYTSFFRGGFSGGPLFYKGNVIGLLVISSEGEYSNLYDLSSAGQWNWINARAVSEVIPALKAAGIHLPTLP